MTALAYKPEPSARADTDEMRAAMFLASEKGCDYCDALDEVRRQYAMEQWPSEAITNYAERRGA